MRRSAGAAYAATVAALAGLLAACGGGFSSAPPPPPNETIHSYVALGDEFTAAPGTGDTVGNDGCQRSAANYPSLLAKDLEIKDFRDVSCIGATTASLNARTKPAKDADPVPPQLEPIGKDTDLVTIGVGIEDRDLLSHAFKVCLTIPCGDLVTVQMVLNDLDAMRTSLTSAVRAVQRRAPRSYIVMVGYPKITPDSGTCRTLPDLEPPALDAANRVLDEINNQVRSVARETGASFLDAAQLSTRHELCTNEPWTEKSGNGQTTDYRPVAAEQRAVADALGELVRNR